MMSERLKHQPIVCLQKLSKKKKFTARIQKNLEGFGRNIKINVVQ